MLTSFNAVTLTWNEVLVKPITPRGEDSFVDGKVQTGEFNFVFQAVSAIAGIPRFIAPGYYCKNFATQHNKFQRTPFDTEAKFSLTYHHPQENMHWTSDFSRKPETYRSMVYLTEPDEPDVFYGSDQGDSNGQ